MVISTCNNNCLDIVTVVNIVVILRHTTTCEVLLPIYSTVLIIILPHGTREIVFLQDHISKYLSWYTIAMGWVLFHGKRMFYK